MLDSVVESIAKLLSGVSPLLLFLFVISFGMYIFWRGMIETRKDNSSVFDIFFISSFLGLVIGRTIYILTNWSRFARYIWYWLPYEKYGDEIFLFRLLPWRFLRVWDWGIEILIMFVAFLLIVSLWSLFVKKWKWSHVFPTAFFTGLCMLGMTFLLLGFVSVNNEWIVQGLVVLLIPFVRFVLTKSTKAVMIGKKEIKVLAAIDTIFIFLSTTYLLYVYLIEGSSNTEKTGILIWGAWAMFGLVLYLLTVNRNTVVIEKVSSVREVSVIDINRPIK